MSETSSGSQFPWKQVSIGSVADVDVGGTPSTAIPIFWGGNVLWMSSGEVHQRRIYDVQGRITELGLRSSNAKLIDPPAVAIALAGQGKTRGTAALTLARLCTNQSVALIKGRSETLDTVFLFHILDSRYEELRMRSSGGGRGGLSKAIIEAIPIALPEIDEQRKIAQVLDTIDNLITFTDRHIAKLKLAKAGLLHDLLTCGIDENGKLRDPIAHPEQFKETRTEIGQIPRDWYVTSLMNVVPQVQYGISVSLDDENGIPVLRMNNLVDGEVDLSELKKSASTEAENLLLEFLDVLFNRTNSIEHVGRTSVWRGQLETASFASYLVRLLPDQSKLLPEYLNLWLNLPEIQILIRRYATPGVHQVNINPTNLRKAIISLPQSIDEQAKIIKKAKIQNSLIRQKQRCLEKLKLLKQGLMTDLLTGCVRVKLDAIKEG